ncbi:amino acid transporter heavy chain SLC3A2 [Pholidichthys leucotaenia]
MFVTYLQLATAEMLHTEYGSIPIPVLSGSLGGSESSPLLALQPDCHFRPMTKEELEAVAGGPGWRKARRYLVALFWLAWVAMLAIAIVITAYSPRPVATPLRWWQKAMFYQMQPDLFTKAQNEESQDTKVHEQLSYLRSLGIGALILRGLLDVELSALNFTANETHFATLAWTQEMLTEISKTDLKVLLDFCKLDVSRHQDVEGNADEPLNISTAVMHALRFWLEQGVSGFVICDTDATYSEKTLLEWRGVLMEFSSQEEERILVVKEKGDVLHLQNDSRQINATLVDVVMRSVLPQTQFHLSMQEVANAVKTHLQTREREIWPSWMNKKLKHQDVALLIHLSQSRAREEALQYGSFTFLPFNTSSSSPSSNSTSSSPSSLPILAFLRSWGCVHFLVLLNIGPESHVLDPAWAPSLPDTGMFVANTEMDRYGSTSLYVLRLRPHEAIVIKLFETGSYS